jgi:hypothetical protein
MWFAAGIIMLLTAVSTMDRQALNLLVDPIRHDLHISDFQMSLLQMAEHERPPRCKERQNRLARWLSVPRTTRSGHFSMYVRPREIPGLSA